MADHISIAKEEIFGPVQSILKFTNLEEVNPGSAEARNENNLSAGHCNALTGQTLAIERANATSYRLAS